LIFDAFDQGGLEQSQVKTDQFEGECANGTKTPQSLNPGEHVLDPAHKGGWQPTVGTPPIAPPRLSVLGVALATTAPPPRALGQLFVDLISMMAHLRSPHDFSQCIVHHGQTRGFRSWIKFEAQRLNHHLSLFPFQNDDERKAAQDRCFPAREQDPRACGCAGHEWRAIRINHQDS
jgi:hypothetical protein